MTWALLLTHLRGETPPALPALPGRLHVLQDDYRSTEELRAITCPPRLTQATGWPLAKARRAIRRLAERQTGPSP